MSPRNHYDLDGEPPPPLTLEVRRRKVMLHLQRWRTGDKDGLRRGIMGMIVVRWIRGNKFWRVVGEVGNHVGREAGGARQRTNRHGEARISIDEGEGRDIQDKHLGRIRLGVIEREFARRKANSLVTVFWGARSRRKAGPKSCWSRITGCSGQLS